jgi:hypothetical protein
MRRVIWRLGKALPAFVLAGGVAALLGACGVSGGTEYRYKLTVEVETPEGMRSGFAVRQVNWAAGRKLTQEADTSSMSHKGEAVMVDLPNGQTLFALMSPDGQETPMLAFGSARQTPATEGVLKVLTPPTQPDDYRGHAGYPRLVRFQNINDPKIVEKVDPADLSASFGAGYRLKRITAQIVDEPITKGLGTRLEWLGIYPEPGLDNDFRPNTNLNLTAAQRLRHGDFQRIN